VVDASKKAHYVIFEDGYDVEVWKNANEQQADSLNRNIIHSRWVTESIEQKEILEHVNKLHLCPLPHRPPVEAFANTTVAFTLVMD